MKSLLFCICAVVLCACVRANKIFTPASLPCASKIYYTEVYMELNGSKNTYYYDGYIASYGRYRTWQETERGGNYGILVLRLDVPDAKDPNTASLFHGSDKNNSLTCDLRRVNPLSDLYQGMGYEQGYFMDEFPYNYSKSATFEKVKCKAYYFELENETRIHYVNEENRTIGYEYKSADLHRIWNATIQLFAEDKDLRMPSRFIGCPDKTYEPTPKEPNCTLDPDSSSSSKTSSHSSGASALGIAFVPIFIAAIISFMAVF